MTHTLRANLQAKALAGRALVVAGVGSGLTAQGAVAGGADALAVYNTAVYRIRNLPSILAFLPGEDPNGLTLTAAPDVIATARKCPVLLGFAAHNPHCDLDRLVAEAAARGADGVTNEPFSGLYGPDFRQALEDAGCGFSREVALIEAGRRRGLMTLGWACDAVEAQRMVDAGADLVGLMLGITADDADMEAAIVRIGAMAEAALRARPDALLLVHGGPLDRPERVAAVLARCPVHGAVTGSSAERTPVVNAVASAVLGFRALSLAQHGRG